MEWAKTPAILYGSFQVWCNWLDHFAPQCSIANNIHTLLNNFSFSPLRSCMIKSYLFIFFDEQEILFTKQHNYKEEIRASSIMLSSKQEGLKPTLKEPKTLFTNDHLARE